jgi:hypothetical protein
VTLKGGVASGQPVRGNAERTRVLLGRFRGSVAWAAVHIAATMSLVWLWCSKICVATVVPNGVGNTTRSSALLCVGVNVAGTRLERFVLIVLWRIYPLNDGFAIMKRFPQL